MSAEAWAAIAGLILTVILSVWGLNRKLQDKIAAQNDIITTQNEAQTKEKIDDLEDRFRERLTANDSRMDRYDLRLEHVEENRHKDMMEIVDRMTKEMRELERSAHSDRLDLIREVGEVKGGISTMNERTDRANKDIGRVFTKIDELEKTVSALNARQDGKDVERLSTR